MKKILFTLITLSILSFNAISAPETKRVCHDKVVNGKTTKVCKDVKVHKKLDGTKVPPKPTAKPAPKPAAKPAAKPDPKL
jgi:hypothetical protein